MKNYLLIVLLMNCSLLFCTEKHTCNCQDTNQYINCLIRKANVYQEKDDLENSILKYIEATSLAEKQHNYHASAVIQNDLSQMCYNWGNVYAAADFSRKAINYALLTTDKELIGKTYVYLGMYYCEMGKYNEGIDMLERKAIPLLKETNSELYICKAYHRLIQVYGNMQKIPIALQYMHLFDKLTHCLVTDEDWLHYYKTKLIVCFFTKQYKEALSYAHKSMILTEEKGCYNNNNHQIYRTAAECYRELGDFTKSNQMYEKAYLLRDAAILRRQSLQLAYYSADHRIKEKEQEIGMLQQQQLTQEAEMLRLRNWWIISISILLILVWFLLYKRQRQKTHLVEIARAAEEKELQMLSLQKETEQRLTYKYIEGLESERHRLATELHDDVCNRLMGLEMKTRSLTSEMSTKAAEQIEVLADIRNRIRNVSHALMPPIFQFATLDEMLKDHIRHLQLPEGMQAEYTSTEGADWGTIPEKIGFEFYRIAQEALSNSIRHSRATLMKVSLSLADGQLSASIQDNGKGFDLNKKKGIGLRTICQRIDSIGGVCHLHSEPGAGTRLEISVRI